MTTKLRPVERRSATAAGWRLACAVVTLVITLAAACTAPVAAPLAEVSAAPADPRATTPWHGEPVVARQLSRNVMVLNHADPTLELATIVELLQRQYEWLAQWFGFAPRWVIVHIGSTYPFGFSLRSGADPEMFLRADGIFDTANNYAHEMTHCFAFELGNSIPHWFNESLADMAWLDSELSLWKRRREAEWLPTLDRIDWRSYELLQLRLARGAGYFPKVLRELWRRRDECRATFDGGTKVDLKNELLVAALSVAAGADVLPELRALGFDVRTRERQRGY